MNHTKRDTNSSHFYLAAMMALGLGSGLGCSTKLTSFVCQQNEDCVSNERTGRCEDTMFCSFSDSSCPSDFRYGSASGQVSGMCTDEVMIGDAAAPDIIDAGAPDASSDLAPPSIGLALGRGHSCVLLEEQFFVASDKKSASICWGNNAAGQLGPTVQMANDGSPVLTYFNSQFNERAATGIAAGLNTTCRYNDEAFECFGDGENSRLGPGASEVYDIVSIDIGPAALSAVCLSGLVEGPNGMLPTANSLYCWGSDEYGLVNLANGSTSTRYSSLQPTFVGNATEEVEDFGVGEKHVCVLTSNRSTLNSKITCWGDTEKRQLAKAPTFDGGTGPLVTIFGKTDIELPGDPEQLAVGYNHSCIIDFDDTVYCWGDNSSKQANPLSTDLTIGEATLITGDAVALSLGRSHSCAIETNTQVYCWGSNDLGQLGQGSNSANTGTPVMVGNTPLSGVDRIESGQDHTCAHVPGEGVYCWGLNDEQQIDTTSTMQYFSAVLSYAESE